MVAHFTMRTYGVNQAFRFVEGIWLHRKCRQIRRKKIGKEIFYTIHAQHVLSYYLYKYHDKSPQIDLIIKMVYLGIIEC